MREERRSPNLLLSVTMVGALLLIFWETKE